MSNTIIVSVVMDECGSTASGTVGNDGDDPNAVLSAITRMHEEETIAEAQHDHGAYAHLQAHREEGLFLPVEV